MRILLFGATGGTGREIIAAGLEQGHYITAFVRNASGLGVKNEKLSIIEGNILDAKSVDKAVRGQDAVISVLGNKTRNAFWKSNTVISSGVKNIINSMEKNKISRLLFVTSFGVSDNIFLPEKLFIKIVLRNIFADIPTQEKLIRESALAWTIVRPARLINGPRTGKYKVSENLPINPLSKISRTDVADFLLSNLTSESSVGKTLIISY